MKIFTPLFALLIISVSVCGQQYVDVDSKISDVSLFPDRAQVTRVASVNLKQGESLLRIPGLSPYIDASSIQVKGEGDFMIVSVNNRMNYLEETGESKEVKTIRSRIEELKIKIEDERTGIEILREKEAFLTANRIVTGKNESISVQELKSISDFYSSTIESVRKGILEKSRLIRKYEEETVKLENQLNQAVRKSQMPSSEVIVSVSSPNPAGGKLVINYLVTNAGWYPSYDLRVDDVDEDVKISYKANVRQNTGIDWNNVILSFSSASPSEPGNIPVLYPYFLDFYEPPAAESFKSRSIPARARIIDEQDPEEAVNIRGVSEMAEASGPPVNIIRSNTSFSFEVDLPQNIVSDGKINTVEVQKLTSTAEYKYVSIPKLQEKAFLTAEIADWEDLNLMNGEANIYFASTFTGTAWLNTDQIADTLTLSLGTDNSITVDRERSKEFTVVRTLGSNRIETRSFNISVRNNKSSDIYITVYDQLPVSQNKDIEVEATELTGGKLNDISGEVRWNLTIPARSSRELIFTYTVKYPKNRKVILD